MDAREELDALRRLAELEAKAAPPTAQDRAQAGAAGINKGFLANLPGLPVDTLLNVVDLAKAGGGYVGSKLGMKPENLPMLTERSSIPGSSDWIAARERDAGMSKVIDPNRPEDAASRVLYAGGQGAAFPVPAAGVSSALLSAGKMGLGGALAQGTTEAGLPQYGPLVGMAPFASAGMRNGVQKPILTPEQIADRQNATALGYELTPGQQTGKRWQQNLEAAMRQAPSTSTRMQQIDAGNQELTNNLVSNALTSAGGEIGQETAASRAFQAMRSGIDAEAAKTGAGYRQLLAGVPVDTAALTKPVTAIRADQQRLPEDQRGGTAMTAVDALLGSPGYAAQQRRGPTNVGLDVARDDIATAVRKLGGINPMDEAVGSLATSFPFEPNPAFGPVWRAQKFGGAGNRSNTVAGHSLDEITQKLYDKGYVSAPHAYDEVMDKLADSSRGTDQHFSIYREPPNVDPLAGAIGDLVAQMKVKNQPPEQRPGFIRTNPTMPGPVAQDLRSAYGAASEAAFTGGKTQQGQVFLSLKQAVDGAIEQALPKEKQGQFASLNQKYGLDMAIKAMSPQNQAAFLEQLYRGSPDQFYTFMGIADPSSFKSVARGFLSKIVNEAKDSKTGNIAAGKMGREIDALNPDVTGRADVMKYLGGDAGQTLAQVGKIGRDVLPDPVANSGTAQRMWYQHLLRGAGALSGGGAGLLAGGGHPLAGIAGAYMGDYLVPKMIQGAYLSPKMRGLLTAQDTSKMSAAERRQLDVLQMLGYSAGL